MLKKIVIVGAGDHGRGTLEIFRAGAAAGKETPEVLGFVDDDPARRGLTPGGLPVLGPVEWLLERAAREPGAGEYAAILAISSPQAKRNLAQKLAPAHIPYVSAVHPSVILGAGTTAGPGAIIGAGVVAAYDTRIGAHTTINLNASLGHDCVIGDYSTIAPGVNITGKVRIGDGAQIQTNATIVPGTTIGAWARVGPGAVVLQDVAEGEFVFGNPARRMPGMKAGKPER